MIGNFNEIPSPDEKKGGVQPDLRKCLNFPNWMNDCRLMEVTTIGTKFTWSGPKWNGRDRVFKKLDHVFCNVKWRLKHDEGFAKVLPRVQSDHHPIMVISEEELSNGVDRPFRFEVAWITHEDFNSLMHEKWDKRFDLLHNISSLTPHLKEWNIETFGNIVRRKNELLARLNGIQNSHNMGIVASLRTLRRSFTSNFL